MRNLFLVTVVIALLAFGGTAQAVTIDTVAIGDPGNAADTAVMGLDGTTGYGSVSYNYNIGKYEVTAGQYTEFLNAVANVSDTYGLYNSLMWNDTAYGCKIKQTSDSGVYSYSVASDYANRPVNYVSYWDSLRFANWLNNGQGSSSTEIGAYTIPNGYNGSDGRDIGRNAGATWAVTSEDEWYKAAYYKNGAYSLYANGTSVAPIAGTASNYNSAIGLTWDGTINGVFEQNGTKDMMGNVFEWTEAMCIGGENRSYRYLRSGRFNESDFFLQSTGRNTVGDPDGDSRGVGFRVSQVVPEPSSILALVSGVIGLAGFRCRTRRA